MRDFEDVDGDCNESQPRYDDDELDEWEWDLDDDDESDEWEWDLDDDDEDGNRETVSTEPEDCPF